MFFTYVPVIVFSQEITTPSPSAPNNIPSTNGTDLVITGGTAAATVGGLAAAFLKDRKDKREVTQSFEKGFKEIVENNNEYVALRNKLDQYLFVYKNYTYAQCLDLPAANNPMDKTSIGQALTNQANKIVNKAQIDYNVPRPQMAIASQSIVSSTQNIASPPTTQHLENKSILSGTETIVNKTTATETKET